MEPVNLLWTGGWDSTFRLLHLVLVQGRSVQPHYLISADRLSLDQEMAAMRAIRDAIGNRSGHAGHLLPTAFAEWPDLPTDDAITGASESVRTRSGLGTQYEWLARYAKHRDLPNLELSMHLEQSDNADDSPHGLIQRSVEPVKIDGEPTWRLSNTPADPDLWFFRFFTFPLMRTTKPQMARIARDHGFMDLMKLTWFCHKPRHGIPCGHCKPCRDAIHEGMARRVPRSNRIRTRLSKYRAYQFARKIAGRT